MSISESDKHQSLSQGNSSERLSSSSKNKVQPKKVAVKDQVLLECKGENGILVVTETTITIKRIGGFLSPHKKGEKHILYEDILDFQYQKSNLLSSGYIYVQVSGSAKDITFFEANASENSS